ncbi:MAG: glycosyltransferase family 4 protein [Muribaculaceae bacterium]|nr:glycosyltransferase family 4 protein [Muribaculaceae bacterium]
MGKEGTVNLAIIGIRGFPYVQGGVESHCEQLIPRFAQKGITTRVYRRKPYLTSLSYTKKYNSVKFVDLPSTKIKGVEALFHTILCTFHLLMHRVDVVNIHNIGPGMMAPIFRLAGIKVVLTYHSPNYEHSKWGCIAKVMLRLCEKISLKASNHIIFVNKFQRAKYSTPIALKSSVIPNGINITEKPSSINFLTKWDITPNGYILAVGRLTPEKGFETLIKAIQAMDNEITLVIAGSQDHNTGYLDYLKSLDTKNRTIFTGYTTGTDLAELYANAKMYVLSSTHEGFPMVLLEAMSYHLPIVASDIPATHIIELSKDNYANAGDFESFKRAIERVLDTQKKPCNYDLGKYNWDNIAEQTVEVYKNVLNAK